MKSLKTNSGVNHIMLIKSKLTSEHEFNNHIYNIYFKISQVY